MVLPQQSRRPNCLTPLLPVRVVVVIVVVIATVLLALHGYDPSTALALIVLVSTTALDLAQRVTVSLTKPARSQ